MNALAFVLRQHRKVEQLLQLVKNDGYRREQRLSELIDELSAHLVVDASLLRPAMQAAAVGVSSREAHAIDRRARSVIDELASARGGAAFATKAAELETLFAQHTSLEEALLPALARTLDGDDLHEIGKDMAHLSFALLDRGRPPAVARREQGISGSRSSSSSRTSSRRRTDQATRW